MGGVGDLRGVGRDRSALGVGEDLSGDAFDHVIHREGVAAHRGGVVGRRFHVAIAAAGWYGKGIIAAQKGGGIFGARGRKVGQIDRRCGNR